MSILLRFGARFILAFLLLLYITGCGAVPVHEDAQAYPKPSDRQAQSTEQLEKHEKSLYRMDVYSQLSNYAGVQEGWFAHVLRERFHIELNIIAHDGGVNRFAVLMASGDLGDLIVFGNDGQDYREAIAAGLLLDWTLDDRLKIYGADILAKVPMAIEKNRVNFGKGVHVYGIGHDSSYMDYGTSEGRDLIWHPEIRWDLYQRLGRPEILRVEDYLPLLKAMQELEPYNEQGHPVYGFSMWPDWDVDKMTLAKQFANMYGYDENGFILLHASEDIYEDILDENGWYLRTLRLYNTANKMGLMDPDSISQSFNDAGAKMRDGRVLFSWFPWFSSGYNTPDRTSQGKGFALVPASDQKVLSFSFNPYGGHRVWAIGAKAEHPERVMAFINWLYTPEGLMISNNGPQGLTWDLKDGRPYVTEFGWQCFEDGRTQIPDDFGGGRWMDGVNHINNGTIQLSSVHPVLGEPYDRNLWISTLERSPSPLVQDWRAVMGAMTPKEYFVNNDMITLSIPYFTGIAPEVMAPGLEQKSNQAAAVIKQLSWQMVFASNENEFERLKTEMTEKAKAFGYDEVAAWQARQAQKTFAERKGT